MARLTWSALARTITPDRVLVVVLCGVAATAVIMLALTVGLSLHPGAGWLVVAVGFGVPGSLLASRMHREHRLDLDRAATRAAKEGSRVDEALSRGPGASAAWPGDDDGEPARAPRPGWH